MSSKVLSQVDTIKALAEALSWLERKRLWGSSPSALPHLVGRIGELFAAVTKNGKMASAINQRGYDIMTNEGNERISVKTVTSSNHVTFNARTFHEVERVLVLKIVEEGDEVSIETVLDEDAATARSLCTTDARGYYTYAIRRGLPSRTLEQMDLLDEAFFGSFYIRQYVNGTIAVDESAAPVPSAIAALRNIAKQIEVDPNNSNGNPRNTRQLGAEVISKLNCRKER